MLSTAAHNTGSARSACNDPCPSIAPQSTALWWHEPARQITHLLEAAARYSSLHSAGRTPGAAAVLQITTSDTPHNAYMAMGSAANSALQSAPSNSIAPCNQIKPRTAYAASLCCSVCCKPMLQPMLQALNTQLEQHCSTQWHRQNHHAKLQGHSTRSSVEQHHSTTARTRLAVGAHSAAYVQATIP